MDQQSAFSVHKKNEPNLFKSRVRKSNSFKLKKIQAKKKHRLSNIKIKELNGQHPQKKIKKQLIKNKLQSIESNLNRRKRIDKNVSLVLKKNNSVKTVKEKKGNQRIERQENDNKEKRTSIKFSNTIKSENKVSIKKKVTIGEDSIQTAKGLLQWIIKPTSVADFFDNNWEKSPLYVKRNDSAYFSKLFSSEALDGMLRNNSLFFKTNVDIAIYEDGVRKDADTAGRAYPSLVWDYYSDGYTVRVSNPQTYNFKLRNLLSSLQEYFGCFVGSNVYLTPPDSQGFAPHYDDIEAFIIQVEGRKHWKLYNPPTEADVLARESSGNYARSSITEPPLKEITLNAGDMVYFPRGTVHEGHTDSDSHSLHVTVSTYQKTAYADLMETLCTQAMKKAIESSVEYRRGLPMQYLMHAGVVNTAKKTNTRKELMRTVRNLFQGLWEHVDVDAAVDEMGRKFMRESLPPQHLPEERERTSRYDGDRLLNGRVIDRAEFSPDSKVRLFRYHCLRLVVDKTKNEAKIYYNVVNEGYKEVEEQYLEIELSDAPIIDSLQQTYPQYMSIESIPHEDLQAKMGLVQVLWQYGLIVTEAKVDICDSDDGEGVEMSVKMVESNVEELESDSDVDELIPIPRKLKKKSVKISK